MTNVVSFNVTELFPIVPIEDALSLLKKWLKQHITEIDSVNLYYRNGKNVHARQLFPQFDGRFYRKTFGTSMGNALSPFLANIFMADLESRLSKLKIFPKVGTCRRYMLYAMKKNTIDRMLAFLRLSTASEYILDLCIIINHFWVKIFHF
jgi:hypothetical protein